MDKLCRVALYTTDIVTLIEGSLDGDRQIESQREMLDEFSEGYGVAVIVKNCMGSFKCSGKLYQIAFSKLVVPV